MISEALKTCALASVVLLAVFAVLALAFGRNPRARYQISLSAFFALAALPLLLAAMWMLRPVSHAPQVEILRTTPTLLSVSGTVKSADYSAFIVPLWAAGATVALLPLLLGLLSLARLSRRSKPVSDSRLLEVFHACAARTGAKAPKLVLDATHWSPGTWGLRPGVVYLPASAASWPDERLESTFIHELAHLKRHDWMLTNAVWAVSCLFWFNPLVWVLRSWMRDSAEFLCDEEVVRVGVSPTSYAEHLLLLVQSVRRPISMRPAGAMLAGYSLESRVAAVLSGRRGSRGMVLPVVLGLTVSLAVSGVLANRFVRVESQKASLRQLEQQLTERTGERTKVFITGGAGEIVRQSQVTFLPIGIPPKIKVLSASDLVLK